MEKIELLKLSGGGAALGFLSGFSSCKKAKILYNSDMRSHRKRFGFTLAEVLITLGVIGVVAALTIPQLVGTYKRKVVEARLSKFYSVMNQAIARSIEEHGDIPFESFSTNDNSEYLLNWYKEYVTKYITTIKEIKQSGSYVKIIFNDGSGFHSVLVQQSSKIYLYYFIDARNEWASFDGKNTFFFVYNPESKQVETFWQNQSYASKKSLCYNPNQKNSCAAVIQANGWKIPDDYPWIR